MKNQKRPALNFTENKNGNRCNAVYLSVRRRTLNGHDQQERPDTEKYGRLATVKVHVCRSLHQFVIYNADTSVATLTKRLRCARPALTSTTIGVLGAFGVIQARNLLRSVPPPKS